jgi:hypothetical protein
MLEDAIALGRDGSGGAAPLLGGSACDADGFGAAGIPMRDQRDVNWRRIERAFEGCSSLPATVPWSSARTARLEASTLADAFDALESRRRAPARAATPWWDFTAARRLFHRWSTPRVLDQTMERAARCGTGVALLPISTISIRPRPAALDRVPRGRRAPPRADRRYARSNLPPG